MTDIINPLPKIKKVSKYYYDDNHLKTHMVSALSSVFDKGERFFMKSLSYYIKIYPEFEEDIKQFIREERNHTLAHNTFNKIVDSINNNDAVQYLETKTGKILNPFYKLPQPLKVLITETLEHITFCLCETALERQDEFDKLYGDAYELLQYHMLEETSEPHCNIASRVFEKTLLERNIFGRLLYKGFRKIIIYPAIIILSCVIISYIRTLYKTNNDFEYIDFIKGVNSLLGLNGWIREALWNSIKTWQKEEH